RLNPCPDVLDDGLWQPCLSGWHCEVGVGVGNGGQEQAGPRVAGNDGRPPVAPCPDCLAGVELQSPGRFARSGRMTLVAVLDQDGPNPGLEECKGLGVTGRFSGGHNAWPEKD